MGVQSFYSSVGYGCGVNPDDKVLAVWAGQSIIAAVRLCTEEDHLVLRGLYVADDRRGLGIGSRLLQATSEAIGSSECWCIPHTHLMDFYSRIGFHVREGEKIPLFLAERHKRYTADGRKVVVMKRTADPAARRFGGST